MSRLLTITVMSCIETSVGGQCPYVDAYRDPATCTLAEMAEGDRVVCTEVRVPKKCPLKKGKGK